LLRIKFDYQHFFAFVTKSTRGDSDVRHLSWLATELGEQLADRLVITTGPVTYRRHDGVAVVPLQQLFRVE